MRWYTNDDDQMLMHVEPNGAIELVFTLKEIEGYMFLFCSFSPKYLINIAYFNEDWEYEQISNNRISAKYIGDDSPDFVREFAIRLMQSIILLS